MRTVTCKLLLNQPHSKLGQNCAARCLILTRRDETIDDAPALRSCAHYLIQIFITMLVRVKLIMCE